MKSLRRPQLIALLVAGAIAIAIALVVGITVPLTRRHYQSSSSSSSSADNNNNNNNSNTTITNTSTSNPGPCRTITPAAGCPEVYVLAARETTQPPGLGSTNTLVDLILKAFPGGRAAFEAIRYPALGSTWDEYAASARAGVAAVANQTEAFVKRCPGSVVVVHGYSQGAQIIDDAYCGGPDGTIINSTARVVSEDVAKNTAAIIWMGNPRHVDGLSYNVGTAVLGGFAPRPPGYQCPEFADRIQSYCDEDDPYCSKGNDKDAHQAYGTRYGDQALKFVVSKINACS